MEANTRAFLTILAVIALLVIVSPFVLLTATGVMRPLEGFCVEHGFADSPKTYAAERSYFAVPELGHRYMWLAPYVAWPVCKRSRQGEHVFLAAQYDDVLSRLEEPNLRRLHRSDSEARTFRLLLVPSSSRDNVVFRLDTNRSGSGVLHASWFVDDNPISPFRGQHADVRAMADAHTAWMREVLPVRAVQRPLSAPEVEAIWTLQRNAKPPTVLEATLDVNSVVVEAVDNGRRTVGVLTLSSPPDAAGELFCALVQKAGVPVQVLENSDVEWVCRQPRDAKIRSQQQSR